MLRIAITLLISALFATTAVADEPVVMLDDKDTETVYELEPFVVDVDSILEIDHERVAELAQLRPRGVRVPPSEWQWGGDLDAFDPESDE